MLVLSRKTGESVIINGNIKVTVVEVRGNKIRLGFVAPPEVTVNREEIDKVARARQCAESAGG